MNDNDLLGFLKYTLGCTYISDLRIENYNTKAKLILSKLDFRNYSLKQITEAYKYIYSDELFN